jgi:hypothetical protein
LIEKEFSGYCFNFIIEKDKSEEYYQRVEIGWKTTRDAHGVVSWIGRMEKW